MRRAFLVLLGCLWIGAHAEVPQGTAVHVMVLKDISSSASRIGETVPLVVTRDIVSEGRIVVPEGSMVFAEVSQCRREGALSAPFFDKPARLALRLEHLRDIDGNAVDLAPEPGKSGDLKITREMTVRPTAAQSKAFEEAFDDPKSRSVMHKIHDLFTDTAVSLSIKETEILAAHNVDIPMVQAAIKAGVFDRLIAFIHDIRHKRTVNALIDLIPLSRSAHIAVEALQELGRLSGGISNYVEGRFKGRNIRCPAGVELTVYAA
ncbi:MAG TPA: hypothetical protein VMI31_10000 [Fimbriimonadaceae bacterium]|nr:hypothetical protein [Fimbriimonadaceae bacterium]